MSCLLGTQLPGALFVVVPLLSPPPLRPAEAMGFFVDMGMGLSRIFYSLETPLPFKDGCTEYLKEGWKKTERVSLKALPGFQRTGGMRLDLKQRRMSRTRCLDLTRKQAGGDKEGASLRLVDEVPGHHEGVPGLEPWLQTPDSNCLGQQGPAGRAQVTP